MTYKYKLVTKEKIICGDCGSEEIDLDDYGYGAHCTKCYSYNRIEVVFR